MGIGNSGQKAAMHYKRDAESTCCSAKWGKNISHTGYSARRYFANIVLNELDWWIASQWEQMPTKTKFKTRNNAQGTEIKSHAYRALRRSRLKEMHAVRYADDFKIMCKTHDDAVRAFNATKNWLKERLYNFGKVRWI